jgi:hypothetical protein
MKKPWPVFVSILTIAASASSSLWSAEPPQSSSEPGPIPYASLEIALKDLHSRPGVTFRNQSGWIVAEDLAAHAVWLLTPPGHPAYPSIVRRMLVNGPSGATMNTDVQCFASQETCDKCFGSK